MTPLRDLHSGTTVRFPNGRAALPEIPRKLQDALDGRYRLERELGMGGMATVYLAEDLRHHRKVALKVLREELGASIGPERFHREIEIAARLHHPHILPLYDSGEAAGFFYYVMPYVEGESLRERLARERELPVADAVRILREVADALAKAHANGVVHRDIKPDNVMLSDRHALVADFGVAKAVSDAATGQGITTVGVALGTPAYMAPEQASADPATDHRADIYAFGAMAYEVLTGSPPFSGHTAQAVLAAHMTQAPAPVTQHRQAVPAALAELVMRCLEKKPADRWQRADEIVTRLEALATPSGGMEPTRAVPGLTGFTAAPRVRRGLLAGVAVLVVLGLVWAFGLRGRGGVPLDPTLVAVLPFRVAATGSDLAYLREGMVDMMATYLTGEGGTARAAEPATVIAEWRRRVADEGQDLTAAEADAVARSVGAGRLLSGSIVGSEARLTVRASLSEVGIRGDPIQATAEGPADSLAAMLRGMVGQLLARSAGVAAEQSAGLQTASLPALRAYLRGQALYRQARYHDAIAQYSDALRADSTFALAGVGLVSANGWTGSAAGDMMGLAQRAAWENRESLGPKDRALIVAVLGPNGPAPDYVSEEIAAAERLAAAAPDRAEAWYIQGDRYMHFGALVGMTDALARAEADLRRSIARDSLQSGVLQHLLLLAARRRDSAEVRRLVALHSRSVADPLDALNERFLAAAFLNDRAEQERVLAVLDTAPLPPDFAGEAGSIAFSLPFVPRQTAAVVEYLDHVKARAVAEGERQLLTTLQSLVEMDAGRPAAAAALAAQVPRADLLTLSWGLFWGGDSAAAGAAAARLAARPVESAPDDLGGQELCLLTLWRVARLEAAPLPGALARLRQAAAARDPAWPPSPGMVCADLVEAMRAQQEGRPDARARVDRVDQMLRKGPFRGANWENLAVARLLEREGEYARAAAAARRFRYYFTPTPFLSTYYRESGRLAELAGDREGAIESYANYLALRQNPEPSVEPEVAEVRRALERLTAEGR